MSQPNILLIMSDQEQQWELLPAALERPAFEDLMGRGTAFGRHHVVVLPCGPSRSTIYTGQHTEQTGVHLNPAPGAFAGMSADVATIGGMLREAGYYTGYKGKWHVSSIDPPVPFHEHRADALDEYGFSDFNPDGDPVGVGWDGYRHDPAIASGAASWIRDAGVARPADRPWFLAVNFVNPHDIMFFDATGRMNASGSVAAPRLPAPSDPIYERSWDVELPASFWEDRATKPAAQALFRGYIDAFLGELPREDEAAWRSFRDYYFNCLRDLDRNVGIVLRALRESGQDRNTVVVYTADHGEAAGAHGLREKPISVYREVLNVPLVIAHPDVAGGSSAQTYSSAIDLAPTLLALAGTAAGEREDRYPALRGVDLSDSLTAPTARTRRDERGVVVSMRRPTRPRAGSVADETNQCLRAVLYDGWKLARYSTPARFAVNSLADVVDPANDLELYDTGADPHELRNLAADPAHRETLLRLGAKLVAGVEAEATAPDSTGA